MPLAHLQQLWLGRKTLYRQIQQVAKLLLVDPQQEELGRVGQPPRSRSSSIKSLRRGWLPRAAPPYLGSNCHFGTPVQPQGTQSSHMLRLREASGFRQASGKMRSCLCWKLSNSELLLAGKARHPLLAILCVLSQVAHKACCRPRRGAKVLSERQGPQQLGAFPDGVEVTAQTGPRAALPSTIPVFTSTVLSVVLAKRGAMAAWVGRATAAGRPS